MSPQLSQQQIAAAIKAFENRLNSKKLECDALNRLRGIVPSVVRIMFPTSPATATGANLQGVALDGVATDYLTAKINWLLIDISEFELQIKMLKSQQSGIVSPGLIINKG